MANAVRSELLEPKNRAFYVAILAGGCADMYRWTRRKLRAQGIDLIIHWDPDDARVTGIPGHVDFVLFFKEYAGKLEPQVMAAVRRFPVPVIRTIRKWSTMQEDLTRWNLLGMCSPLPPDGGDVDVAEPEDPGDTEAEEARAIALAERRARAAQAKDDEERRRRDEERKAAEERAARHEAQRVAMGLPAHQRSRLEELRDEDAREAERRHDLDEACRLALEADPVAPGATPVHQVTTVLEEEPMQKISPPPPMPKTNGAAHHVNGAVAAPTAVGVELGPVLAGLVATHLRGLSDDDLVAAIGPAALAKLVRGLADPALVETGKEYARRMLAKTFGGGAAPAHSVVASAPPAPTPSVRMAPARERVYQALITMATASGGACRLADVAEHLGDPGNAAAISQQLRALREDGLAFQAGRASHSFWALSRTAADRALKQARG